MSPAVATSDVRPQECRICLGKLHPNLTSDTYIKTVRLGPDSHVSDARLLRPLDRNLTLLRPHPTERCCPNRAPVAPSKPGLPSGLSTRESTANDPASKVATPYEVRSRICTRVDDGLGLRCGSRGAAPCRLRQRLPQRRQIAEAGDQSPADSVRCTQGRLPHPTTRAGAPTASPSSAIPCRGPCPGWARTAAPLWAF
jgi:hypothetical protein